MKKVAESPASPARGAGPARWQDQLRAAYRSLDALRALWPGLRPTPAMREAERRFPLAVTPYYASLVRRPDASDPIFAQCVPAAGELLAAPWASRDPLAEVPFSPLPRLVRRYPDRAVLLACDACACRCRHCFRKRVSARGGPAVSDAELAEVARFLRANPSIDDVLVSGGDPLLLPDARVAAADTPSVITFSDSSAPGSFTSRSPSTRVRHASARVQPVWPGARYATIHFRHVPLPPHGASAGSPEAICASSSVIPASTSTVRPSNMKCTLYFIAFTPPCCLLA